MDLRVDGKGLQLTPAPIITKFNGVPLDIEPPNVMHLQQVDPHTKKVSAETVVPTLPEMSFVHFKALFQKTLQILEN